MSATSATNRRSFLARGAALAAVPAVATLVGEAFAEPAFADALLARLRRAGVTVRFPAVTAEPRS